MSFNFEKFDKQVDIEGLEKDIKAAAENNMEFKEVPAGTYKVIVSDFYFVDFKKTNEV